MDSELDVYATHKQRSSGRVSKSKDIKTSMGLLISDHTAEVTAPHIASCSTYDFNSKQPIAVIPNPWSFRQNVPSCQNINMQVKIRRRIKKSTALYPSLLRFALFSSKWSKRSGRCSDALVIMYRNNSQRVSFSVENPLVKGDDWWRGEKQVEVLECLCQEEALHHVVFFTSVHLNSKK